MSNSKNNRVTDFVSNKEIFLHGAYVFNEPINNPFTYNIENVIHPLSGNDLLYNIYFNANSYGYRSDEFTTDHNGKHILFSGCSVTHGIGLAEEELWCKRLFNKINEKEQTSGYFNLAVSGMGIPEIVSNVFKYINQFGKPDCIFLNVPDSYRVYLYNNHDKNFYHAQFDFQNDSNLYKEAGHPKFIMSSGFIPICYQYLMMLELYCQSNDIYLSYISWTQEPNFLNSDLRNLNRYSEKEFKKHIADYVDNNPNDKNFSYARDMRHQGTAPHYAWSEILYNEYVEKTEL